MSETIKKTFAVSMNFKSIVPGNDLIEQNYIRYFDTFGIRPLLIPSVVDQPADYCLHFGVDGVILTGGTDIAEELINANSAERRNVCVGRDSVEWKLVEMALHRKLPVLGLCRGMQFLNIFFGGNIVSHMSQSIPGAINHVANDHDVTISDAGFQQIMSCDSLTVNSFHNHGITDDTLSKSLCRFAHSTQDGIIEGLFHPDLPIMGIEWHPERRKKRNHHESQLLETFFNKGKFWGV